MVCARARARTRTRGAARSRDAWRRRRATAGDTRLEFVVTATSVDAAQAVANNLAGDTLNRRALPPADRARRRGPGDAAWEAQAP